jgi:hypothetical protein
VYGTAALDSKYGINSKSMSFRDGDEHMEMQGPEGSTTYEELNQMRADDGSSMNAAIKKKVARELTQALKTAKGSSSSSMAYLGNKPTEMLRCIQDVEMHYRDVLEEKVWEMVQMREANKELTKKMVEQETSRVEELRIAREREANWKAMEKRAADAEDRCARLEGRVRALVKFEELNHKLADEVDSLKLRLESMRTRTDMVSVEACDSQLGLERFRAEWEAERGELKDQIVEVNQKNRMFNTQILTLQTALDNREAELDRWQKWGDATEGGGLEAAEAERFRLRDEIRGPPPAPGRGRGRHCRADYRANIAGWVTGLTLSVEHKDGVMALLVGQLDMMIGATVRNAGAMVRHGGGFERLADFLSRACRTEERLRQVRLCSSCLRTTIWL